MMNFIPGGVCAAQGFKAAGVHMGVKTRNTEKKDVALIVSETECSAAAVFTKNVVKAAPIHVDKKHLENGKARAIIANSGNANACAPNGEENAIRMCQAAAAAIGCDKYRTGCHHCPLIGQYPKTYFDFSKTMYRKKRQWFTGVKNLTIVTPSHWLAGKVGESFLQDYPVQVIHNGIDRTVFKPCTEDVRQKYGITGKYVALGVAYAWDDKKGLDAMLHLSEALGSDYQIVLVGTDENVDAKLPEGIVSIHRTQNQQELAQLYSVADVFVNPTREDTFPTVNMEALCCGTPIVTIATGGSPEILSEDCGLVVPKNDLQGLANAVRRVCEERLFTADACVQRGQRFDGQNCIEEYLELYERITAKGI